MALPACRRTPPPAVSTAPSGTTIPEGRLRAESMPGVRGYDSARFHLTTNDDPSTSEANLNWIEAGFDVALDILGAERRTGMRYDIIRLAHPKMHEDASRACGHVAEADCSHIAGFYSRRCGAIHLGYVPETYDPAATKRALMHEVVHLACKVAGYPPLLGNGAWLSEGLAGLFESFDPERGRFESVAIERFAQARAVWGTELWPEAREFLELDRAKLAALPPQRVFYEFNSIVHDRGISVHHAVSFAWAAYLQNRDASAFGRFVRRAMREGALPEVVADEFGVEFPAISSEFDLWMRNFGKLDAAASSSKAR